MFEVRRGRAPVLGGHILPLPGPEQPGEDHSVADILVDEIHLISPLDPGQVEDGVVEVEGLASELSEGPSHRVAREERGVEGVGLPAGGELDEPDGAPHE